MHPNTHTHTMEGDEPVGGNKPFSLKALYYIPVKVLISHLEDLFHQ